MTVREMLQTAKFDYDFAVFDIDGNLLTITCYNHAYIAQSPALDEEILHWYIDGKNQSTINVIVNL